MRSKPWWIEAAQREVADGGTSRDQVVIAPRRSNGVPVVVYQPLRCPHCGSTNVVVTKTLPDEQLRRHLCRSCKRSFKSVNQEDLPSPG